MQHRFRLDSLLPDTVYECKLVSNSAFKDVPARLSASRFFRTTGANSSDGITFLSTSDVHAEFPAELASRMKSELPDLVVEAGDMTNWGRRNPDWKDYFETTSELYSGINDSVPSTLRVPCIGNHDAGFFGKGKFKAYFGGIGNVSPITNCNLLIYLFIQALVNFCMVFADLLLVTVNGSISFKTLIRYKEKDIRN